MLTSEPETQKSCLVPLTSTIVRQHSYLAALSMGPGQHCHPCVWVLSTWQYCSLCLCTFLCVYFCGTRAALPSMCVCTFYMATLHSELYCPAGRFHQLLHRWLSSIATDGDWRDNAMVLFSAFPFSDIPAFSLACLVCLTISILPTNVVNFNNSKSLLWLCGGVS